MRHIPQRFRDKRTQERSTPPAPPRKSIDPRPSGADRSERGTVAWLSVVSPFTRRLCLGIATGADAEQHRVLRVTDSNRNNRTILTSCVKGNLARTILFLEVGIVVYWVAGGFGRHQCMIGSRWREEKGMHCTRSIIASNAQSALTGRREQRGTRQGSLQPVHRPAGFGKALPLGCDQPVIW